MIEFAMGPSLLFCPADRPDRYRKAAERADAVILDLEDAVAPSDKAAARAALFDNPLDPATTIVRVNAFDTDDFDLDLAAIATTGYRTIMLAKAERADHLVALAGYEVVALCETARGVANAGEIAAVDHVVAVMWGAEDLVASLGGTSSRRSDGSYRPVAGHARSTVLLAARANDTAAIDSVYLDIADTDGLAAEAEDAAASGFAATACIHPGQVETIRAAYAPTEVQVAWARGVLAEAAQRAEATGGGVFAYDGRMVDEPVLRHAQSILGRSSRGRSSVAEPRPGVGPS